MQMGHITYHQDQKRTQEVGDRARAVIKLQQRVLAIKIPAHVSKERACSLFNILIIPYVIRIICRMYIIYIYITLILIIYLQDQKRTQEVGDRARAVIGN
jgi:hypothetical protein